MKLIKRNNWVVLAIIALPSLFYIGLKTGSHNYNRLPIYGENKEIIKVKRTTKEFYTVTNFSFLNQNNEVFTEDDIINKLTVIGFFNIDDHEESPEILTNLKYLHQKFEGTKNVQFVAISTTEINQNQLKKLADKVSKNTDNWQFVSANQSEIEAFFYNKLYVEKPISTKIPTDIVLIDFKGRIRGYFDGTIHKTVKQDVIDAIDILLKEVYVPLKEDRNKTKITVK